ncbi:thioredoxin family protein [Raineyella sp. LH-20]|uniref:thioredoxin family protein n=1 Tax=Raineyella sp. LH-20 TaxID=3081204 RepID=UPI002954E55B|nr:thioredoxin domain-containing protein [Raineyella sp. LH-20]WOP19583.1 thioredoxin domain-containing protein [Raineyella sp. LH-20]
METPILDAVTDATFAERVLAANVPVVVDYWAPWCSPCRQLDPILEELAVRFGGRVRFLRLDTDANGVTPDVQGVRGLPTVQLFVAGQEVRRFQGAKTKLELQNAVESVLA